MELLAFSQYNSLSRLELERGLRASIPETATYIGDAVSFEYGIKIPFTVPHEVGVSLLGDLYKELP